MFLGEARYELRLAIIEKEEVLLFEAANRLPFGVANYYRPDTRFTRDVNEVGISVVEISREFV